MNRAVTPKVLERASGVALWWGIKSGAGPPHSKTLREAPGLGSWSQCMGETERNLCARHFLRHRFESTLGHRKSRD